MKTIMLWLMLCIGTGAIYAQTIGKPEAKPKKDYYQKGELMLGFGTRHGVSLYNTMENGFSNERLGYLTTGFSFGKFVANKLLVGTRLGYQYNLVRGPGLVATGSQHQISTALFGRYYLGQRTFTPFVESGFGLNHFARTGDQKGYNAQFFMENKVGLSYRPGKRMSVEGSLGLKSHYNRWGGFNHRFNFNLGVNFHF